MYKLLLFVFLLVSCSVFSQTKEITTSVDAEIEGGAAALEQVLQTQLTLPKALLTKNFDQNIIMYFELDSMNNPMRVTFNKGLNNALRKELLRMMKFLKFKKKTAHNEVPYEYFISLHLSTGKYNRYLKQKSKNHVKLKLADSSMVIFTKADKSPDYYKNSDEGLTEYFTSNVEYPAIAKEKSIEGTVILEFVVETNGFVTGIVVKQPVAGGCTEEAVRLIKETKWQPAERNGKAVRYRMTYPMTFSLRNIFKDNSTPRQGAY